MKEFWQKIGKSEIRNLLAVLVTIGAFTILHFMLIKEIPTPNKDTVNLAIGVVLGGMIGPVYGHFFGSSKKEEEPKKD